MAGPFSGHILFFKRGVRPGLFQENCQRHDLEVRTQPVADPLYPGHLTAFPDVHVEKRETGGYISASSVRAPAAAFSNFSAERE